MPFAIKHLAFGIVLASLALDNCLPAPSLSLHCFCRSLFYFFALIFRLIKYLCSSLYTSFSLFLLHKCRVRPTRRMRNFHKYFKYLMRSPPLTPYTPGIVDPLSLSLGPSLSHPLCLSSFIRPLFCLFVFRMFLSSI